MNSYTMLSLSLAISKISLNPRVRDLNIQMQLHIREELKKKCDEGHILRGKGAKPRVCHTQKKIIVKM